MKREPYIIRKVAGKLAFSLNTTRVPVFPREIWIEPTTRCNIRCITCEKYLKPPGRDFDMAPDVYERIREQLLPRVFRANLIGLGEPLFSPLFPRMVDDCIHHGVKFGYTTNGVLLTPELVEKTVKHGWGITLSLDGATKETFESIRRGIRFETMLEKIEMVRTMLEKHTPPEFTFAWNFVGMERNIAELPDLVTMAAKSGVGVITVFNFGVGGRYDDIARESLGYYPKLAQRYFDRARNIAAQHGIDLLLPQYEVMENSEGTESGSESPATIEDTASARASYADTFTTALPEGESFPVDHVRHCYSPWYQAYFRANGDIWPCCMFSTYSLGNIKEQDFADLWNGKLYRELRKCIHSRNPPYWCARCNLSWGITGGDEMYYYRHRPF